MSFREKNSPQAEVTSERSATGDECRIASIREESPKPQPKHEISDDPSWLFLLERFQGAQSAADLNSFRNWRDLLGTSIDHAIEQLKQHGLIQPASPTSIFTAKFGAKELKLLAKQRGVSSSGTKADIAERLVAQDAEWLKTVLGVNDSYVCTSDGLALVNANLQKKKQEREDAENAVISALRESQFETACRTVAGYEVRQPSPRGVGIDWDNYSPGEDLRFLRLLFATKPARFADASDGQLLGARVAAGMVHLWGDELNLRWLDDLEFSLSDFAIVDVAEQLFHSASHRAQLDRFREAGIKKCFLLPGTEPCRACLEFENKQVSLDKIPEIPLPYCTSQLCNCSVTAAL